MLDNLGKLGLKTQRVQYCSSKGVHFTDHHPFMQSVDNYASSVHFNI